MRNEYLVMNDLLPQEFDIRDIRQIRAVRFKGVYSGQEAMETISALHMKDPGVEKFDVGLLDIRPPGTHAYEVKLKSGWLWNITIWEKYLPNFPKPAEN